MICTIPILYVHYRREKREGRGKPLPALMMEWSDLRIVSFMVVGLLIKPESRPRYLVMCKRDEFEFSSRVIAGPWFMIAPFPIYDSRSAVSVSRLEYVRSGSGTAGALSLAALWVVLLLDPLSPLLRQYTKCFPYSSDHWVAIACAIPG